MDAHTHISAMMHAHTQGTDGRDTHVCIADTKRDLYLSERDINVHISKRDINVHICKRGTDLALSDAMTKGIRWLVNAHAASIRKQDHTATRKVA